jgi:hypothetical protein
MSIRDLKELKEILTDYIKWVILWHMKNNNRNYSDYQLCVLQSIKEKIK